MAIDESSYRSRTQVDDRESSWRSLLGKGAGFEAREQGEGGEYQVESFVIDEARALAMRKSQAAGWQKEGGDLGVAALGESEKFRSSIAAGMNIYKTLVSANKIYARIVFYRLF